MKTIRTTLLLALGLCTALTLLTPPDVSASGSESTPADPEPTFSATLAFWKSSQIPKIEELEVPLNVDSIKESEFTWTDPQECFVIDDKAGGGLATDFTLGFDQNEIIFSYVRNSKRCCDELESCNELETTATRETFSSFKLTVDESTKQLQDPLMVAVDDYRQSYVVDEYHGINAVPAVTMQIYPTSSGDTVVNDAEYPASYSPRVVVVGFWNHPEEGYQPEEGENPCEGEPTMKIAYPLDLASFCDSQEPKCCFGWKHWTLEGLHANSARDFSCVNGVFSYTQWTTMTCHQSMEVGIGGTPKIASPDKCARDMPPQIWSQILSGCGKNPPEHKPLNGWTHR